VINRTWTVAALLVGALTVTACGADSGAGMQPTITIAEANTRVDDYIARAIKALPSQATLKLTLQELHGDCSDPTDNGPKNRVVANRSYQVLGLDPQEIPSYFGMLRAWWQANGFRVLDDKPANEFLWVENNADSFQMTLKANAKGGIFLLAGSPCVWPNGTPEPSAAALGDTHTADVAATPNEPLRPTVTTSDVSKPRQATSKISIRSTGLMSPRTEEVEPGTGSCQPPIHD